MSLSWAVVAKVSGIWVLLSWKLQFVTVINYFYQLLRREAWIGKWKKLAHNTKSNEEKGIMYLRWLIADKKCNLNFLVGWATANNMHFNTSKRKVLHLAIKNVGDVCSGKQWLCERSEHWEAILRERWGGEEVALHQRLLLMARSSAGISRCSSKTGELKEEPWISWMP